jgi:hypothetical protein
MSAIYPLKSISCYREQRRSRCCASPWNGERRLIRIGLYGLHLQRTSKRIAVRFLMSLGTREIVRGMNCLNDPDQPPPASLLLRACNGSAMYGSVSPQRLVRWTRGCESRIHFSNPLCEAKLRLHFAPYCSPPLERAQCQRPSYSSWVQPCSTSRWAYFDVPCFKGDRETG